MRRSLDNHSLLSLLMPVQVQEIERALLQAPYTRVMTQPEADLESRLKLGYGRAWDEQHADPDVAMMHPETKAELGKSQIFNFITGSQIAVVTNDAMRLGEVWLLCTRLPSWVPYAADPPICIEDDGRIIVTMPQLMTIISAPPVRNEIGTPVHDRIQEACLTAWNIGQFSITRIGLLSEQYAELAVEAAHQHEHSSYYGREPSPAYYERMKRGEVLINRTTGSVIEITRL